MEKIEFTKEEISNLLVLLDRVQITGTTEAFALLQIVNKLKGGLPVPLVKEDN